MTTQSSNTVVGTQQLPDLVCLSHLRWNFVFQRPQHLLSRFARERRVFFYEEPIFGQGRPRLHVTRSPEGVWVAVPHLPEGLDPERVVALQQEMLDELLLEHAVRHYVSWYYTPMALPFTRHLQPRAVAYDCMDELSAFRGAPPALLRYELELLQRAHVVFTGGQSLYEAKRDRHHSVHAFPSSVDVAHFATARGELREPADQASIPHPRLGFFGVVDERMDLALLEAVADARPDWQLVIIGPVVKIDPATLPRRPNLHFLGGKLYTELPSYLAGWDVALLPFARNESTRFISPTKTPEYLAAGKPVVSTSIRDVVRPYGELGLVRIADTPEDFVRACEAALAEDRAAWLPRVDEYLAEMSWDNTWSGMKALLDAASARREVGVTPEVAAASEEMATV
ncbi:glycosyltransferase family 1 protein [Archangium violaceum]|uniref:glycosyltransferase family 1 protein n=1 Tax=Archangium violaceum TaxID=83451 RepID=UPI00193AE45C|nr:glycosyltransferase family 1 protein [Archangium violaceum]QRK08715.1 glycosyltransferase family 1 protein [Archangium violaceum]